jgi:hypothetical protein
MLNSEPYVLRKKVVIHRKDSKSPFSAKNAKVLPVGYHKIGSSINAVKEMTVNKEMLDTLMSSPALLGISSKQQDFVKLVTNYWNSLSVNVPEGGKQLEIGFRYNLSDESKREAIKSFKKNPDSDKLYEFSSNKDLCDVVEKYVREEDRWLYGTPIEPADYLLWRYCLNYRDVANTYADVKMSKKIRFYMHNEAEIKKIEKDLMQLKSKAGKLFYEIMDKPEVVEDYLYVLGKGGSLSIMDDLDKTKLLEQIFNNDPASLINASKDKLMDKKAFVEKCVAKGLLRRLPNSNIIVNASDNKPIGNNMQDAIAFLDAEANVMVRNELEGRLTALPASN